ncbi:uncharacterized protein LTR77_005064 [Saxophila tyrrhenica]|uniref:Xylanolytic transcriptional activator regulatory domain-containing protein n=1 Tax=Saxophila tyrrhenica TaxID=1690608 RepID=A0AAV9PBU3_9PEZI|nr:hypothetical protein LTR77_005064 [Saxophila tyrrhenica]
MVAFKSLYSRRSLTSLRQVCEYVEPTSRKRKRKDVEELQSRLDRYEHLLKQNGLLSKHDAKQESPSTNNLEPRDSSGPSTATADTTRPTSRSGVLVAGSEPGQTRYVESALWEDLGEDLHPSSDDEAEPAQASTPARELPSYVSPGDLVSAAFSGPSPQTYNLADLHPPPEMARKLWQVYLRNADPILKFVHGPSTTAIVEKYCSNVYALPKETECLLFAIYHFAVTSMVDGDRQELLGHSWPEIRAQYHDATRQCLIACSFYQTTSFPVLQAYALLLASMRFRYNPHTFWILSGIQVRLAQRMGLHSEDERQLSPFDVQMRRRVWWYVLITDHFAAQQAGTTSATMPIEFWDSPKPLNVDDKDIWPGMTQRPQEKEAATDMLVFLVRVEITSFRAKMSRAPGKSTDMEASLKELENRIQSKFTRHCDVTNPVHYMIMVGNQAAMLNARLRTRLTRVKKGEASDAERKEVFAVALKILDHDVALQTNELATRFSWQWQAFFSWEPLICALKELCEEQDPGQVDSAWEKVERVFKGHPNIVTPSRAIEVAIGRLALRAWDLTQRRSSAPPREPAFLGSLRQFFRVREEARKTSPAAKHTPTEQSAETQHDTYPPLGELETLDDFGADIDWNFWDDLIRDSELDSSRVQG